MTQLSCPCVLLVLKDGTPWHQQQQGILFTGVVHAIPAAQLIKMIYMLGAHRATDTVENDLASYLFHEMSAKTQFTHSTLRVVRDWLLLTAAALEPRQPNLESSFPIPNANLVHIETRKWLHRQDVWRLLSVCALSYAYLHSPYLTMDYGVVQVNLNNYSWLTFLERCCPRYL